MKRHFSHVPPSELQAMLPPPEILSQAWDRSKALDDLFDQLAFIYVQMDNAYNKISRNLEFDCLNCPDNCCHQTFYHFTWIEYLYLLKGLCALPDKAKEQILKSSLDNCSSAPSAKPVCGANQKSLCRLYAHRPMICRLHGIAHSLTRPDGRTVTGPGCFRFEALQTSRKVVRLDRTPFYANLAKLEQLTRERLAVTLSFRMTVSQMLITYSYLDKNKI